LHVVGSPDYGLTVSDEWLVEYLLDAIWRYTESLDSFCKKMIERERLSFSVERGDVFWIVQYMECVASQLHCIYLPCVAKISPTECQISCKDD
jgi:hypothetical protein